MVEKKGPVYEVNLNTPAAGVFLAVLLSSVLDTMMNILTPSI